MDNNAFYALKEIKTRNCIFCILFFKSQYGMGVKENYFVFVLAGTYVRDNEHDRQDEKQSFLPLY